MKLWLQLNQDNQLYSEFEVSIQTLTNFAIACYEAQFLIHEFTHKLENKNKNEVYPQDATKFQVCEFHKDHLREGGRLWRRSC